MKLTLSFTIILATLMPAADLMASPKSVPSISRRSSILGLVGWVALCFVAAVLGAFALPDAWYATLHKPSRAGPAPTFVRLNWN